MRPFFEKSTDFWFFENFPLFAIFKVKENAFFKRKVGVFSKSRLVKMCISHTHKNVCSGDQKKPPTKFLKIFTKKTLLLKVKRL